MHLSDVKPDSESEKSEFLDDEDSDNVESGDDKEVDKNAYSAFSFCQFADEDEPSNWENDSSPGIRKNENESVFSSGRSSGRIDGMDLPSSFQRPRFQTMVLSYIHLVCVIQHSKLFIRSPRIYVRIRSWAQNSADKSSKIG